MIDYRVKNKLGFLLWFWSMQRMREKGDPLSHRLILEDWVRQSLVPRVLFIHFMYSSCMLHLSRTWFRCQIA